MSKLWKPHYHSYREALDYIKGRQTGVIKSFKTPWSSFNAAGADGIEWNTVNVIGGRPGAGKSLIKDQIIRESFSLNPDKPFRVLKFELEMLARATAIREFSGAIEKSYKSICSADGNILSDTDIVRISDYARNRSNFPIDIIENPPTVPDMIKIIDAYMETYAASVFKAIDDGVTIKRVPVKEYTPTVITIDHTYLLVKHATEGSKLDTLYALGEAVTHLKRKYPIIFIILSQLNRNIDNPDRNEQGVYGNYVLESDFFGSDALNQHTDVLVGLNRPAKQKIRFYGPDKYIINDDSTLAVHFLKCRNGITQLSFFKAEFDKMRIVETSPPPTATKRI